MNLVVDSHGRIVAAAAYAINEQDCATRNETVVYIDDSFYKQEMIGALYLDSDPYYAIPPTPFHSIINREYVLTEADVIRFWEEVRALRNYLLAQTDWTQLQDVVLTKEEAESWKEIRTNLRNATDLYSDPESAFAYLETYGKSTGIVK